MPPPRQVRTRCIPSRAIALAAGLLALQLAHIGASPLQAIDRFRLPDVAMPPGEPGRLFVSCYHDFALSAFSVGIDYDPAALRVNAFTFVEATLDQTPLFVEPTHDPSTGEITLVVVLDLQQPLLTAIQPPDPPQRLMRIDVENVAPEGSTTALSFVDGAGPFDNVNNTYVDDLARTIAPDLVSGSVRSVALTPLTVQAGGDRTVAEGERVDLQADIDLPNEAASSTISWSQISGPAVNAASPADRTSFSFDVPPVAGDTSLDFRVDVEDELGREASDIVRVRAIDLDQRTNSVSSSLPQTEVLEGGHRVLVFAGAIAWTSAVEGAIVESVEFTARGGDDAFDELAGIILYRDADDDGALDADVDVELASAPPPTPGAPIIRFVLNESLSAGESLDVLLVVELQEGASAAFTPWLLLLAALAVALPVAARRGRRRIARGGRGGRGAELESVRAPIVSLVLALGLVATVLSCSSGSGGGSDGSDSTPGVTPGASEIRFELQAPDGVELRGEDSGVPVPAGGLPVIGPTLEL